MTTTLQRWHPVRDFARMQDEVNRLFESGFGIGRQTESFGWTPAVDVFEDTEGVTFKFDLPEVEGKDVDVRLEDATLTIRGERKLEKEEKGKKGPAAVSAQGAVPNTAASVESK